MRISNSDKRADKSATRLIGWPASAASEVARSRRSSGNAFRRMFTLIPIPTTTNLPWVRELLLSQSTPPSFR